MERTQAEAFEQYIRDLRVVRSISRPSFPEGKAPAAVLEEIQTNALRCNTLMRQNETLLAQFVYDRDPAALTEEDIQGLSAFAGRLFNYANSEDMGVAFKVHQLLLAAARSREDVPMIVRELYYTGITLHYMNVRDEGTGINLLGDAIQVYFTEAAEYMSRYEQLDSWTGIPGSISSAVWATPGWGCPAAPMRKAAGIWSGSAAQWRSSSLRITMHWTRSSPGKATSIPCTWTA